MLYTPCSRSLFSLHRGVSRPQDAESPLLARASAGSSTSAPQSLDDGVVALDRTLTDASSLSDDKVQTEATALVRRMVDTGAARAFGQARRVPKRTYTLADLRMHRIDSKQLLAREDETLDRVRAQLQLAYVAGLVAVGFATGWELQYVGSIVFGSIFLLGVDQVAYMGGLSALVIDTVGRWTSKGYSARVALHEAGHFLVGYLCGLLPIAYTLSSWDACRRYKALNVQAGCRFADHAFAAEQRSGTLSARSLDDFACVALAGVSAEYIAFGHAEGGTEDLVSLDRLLKALAFTQQKADEEIYWAVLNTVSLLRRHKPTHEKLAVAMADGATVGACVRLIEDDLAQSDDL